ncbi:chemotaxis protein CheW [Sphingosinicella sp. CPCC 101087]|uniref:chemotaxis protein CheW n=1 Tax=Sphingosinicella sp. CPCC 101087 TaxID=2497754 RepID=UPI00101DDB95|nr:chemotaxis protein CheW [Sphingosinicella sp. CPCC 101087]
MPDLLLIIRLAGRRVALPASEVEGVVELDGITPTPRAAVHVAGLSALRSRVLTVIDGLAALELGRSPAEGLLEAIVVPSGGHTYALLVDSVEDVVETARPPVPIRAPVGPGWDRIAIGMVEAEDDLLLLVDPHLIIAGPAAQAA